MKRLLPVLLAMACGGPSVEKVVETPAAKEQRHPTEAPSASTSDEDRNRLRNSFDDMETTQRAYREAEHGTGSAAGSGSAAPTGKHVEYPPDYKPVKKGPAEQAPKQ